MTLFRKISFLKYLQILILAIAIGLAFGCGDDDPIAKPKSTSINKIMPLGASRVEGARPEFESFRYELWKLLITDGWDVDYIGTMTDEASYPDFTDLSFDPDHEGRGGWTSGEILENMAEWLDATGAPDIVLFSSPGGNDILNSLIAYNQIISNINEIIDLLQAANSNITIVIERPAPGMSSFMTPEFIEAFNNMQQDVLTIAAQQTTATSQVIAVDMFTGFTDNFLADEVHYNEAGAKFIADRYYAILEDILKPN